MIKFAYTILYVQDVAKSVAFYEQAFGFARKFITPDHDYAEIESGSTVLAFASLSLAQSNLKKGFISSQISQRPFGIELGFTSEDVAASISQALEAGATLEEEAKTKPWGQTVAYVRDLDGFLIEICSPMG